MSYYLDLQKKMMELLIDFLMQNSLQELIVVSGIIPPPIYIGETEGDAGADGIFISKDPPAI
jgi:hypothetical protein